MNDTIVVAVIAASASIVVAALTFYLTKRHELFVQWRGEKLNHYKVLFSALSDLAADSTDIDASRRFALAVNTIALVAPQYVIDALMAFQIFHCRPQFTISDPNEVHKQHVKLLNGLLMAVRRDIGLAKGDDNATFNFQLIGSAPKESGNKSLQPRTNPVPSKNIPKSS